ncbi:MAG: Rieske 2Fe-2S domain-containing protein [Prochloraceae cyanobacterium]
MTITSNFSQIESSSYPEETGSQFNWQNCWYPISFIKDLPSDRPLGFSLYDEPFVIFRDGEGKLNCLQDRCSHRAAKLSKGQILDGKIECSYHGWQFDGEGKCTKIPQLPRSAKIPHNSCVKSFEIIEKQGIVWMWRGKQEDADESSIPTVADMDDPSFVSSDYTLDLPYDRSYFIENVVDPSHIFISHEKTFNARQAAQPLKMEVLELNETGFKGRYSIKIGDRNSATDLNFIAPNLVTYRIVYPHKISGAILYSLPTGTGKCRIIIRNYTNKPDWKLKFQPRWMEHWYRSHFVEEDLSLVVEQQKEINRLGKSLQELYLPLKTSDLFVVEYRRWLDKYGNNLPYYQGYTTSKTRKKIIQDSQEPAPLDRLRRHTEICSSCSKAYENTIKVKQIGIGMAIVFAAIAIVTDGSKIEIVAVLLSMLSLVTTLVAQKIKTHFEQAYTRH